jgi:hypothetical protein
MRAFASWLLLALPAGLLAAAVYPLIQAVPSAAPGLIVEEPDLDLGEVSHKHFGKDKQSPPRASDDDAREICYTITNRGRRAAAIVGAENECGMNVCIGVNHPGRVVLRPGESFTLRWTVYFKFLGPFEASVPLYVDDGGLRTIWLSVRGTSVAPASPLP